MQHPRRSADARVADWRARREFALHPSTRPPPTRFPARRHGPFVHSAGLHPRETRGRGPSFVNVNKRNGSVCTRAAPTHRPVCVLVHRAPGLWARHTGPCRPRPQRTREACAPAYTVQRGGAAGAGRSCRSRGRQHGVRLNAVHVRDTADLGILSACMHANATPVPNCAKHDREHGHDALGPGKACQGSRGAHDKVMTCRAVLLCARARGYGCWRPAEPEVENPRQRRQVASSPRVRQPEQKTARFRSR